MFGSIVEFDKLCSDIDFISKMMGELQSRIVGIEEKQNQDISEYKEQLSDITNRIEKSLANELEKRVSESEKDYWFMSYNKLREKNEKLEAEIEKLETENEKLIAENKNLISDNEALRKIALHRNFAILSKGD